MSGSAGHPVCVATMTPALGTEAAQTTRKEMGGTAFCYSVTMETGI